MIADDVAAMRNLTRIFLADEPGLEVVGEAATGSETLACVSRLTPDVLLLDLSMPDMDGFEVLIALRAAAARVAVVVFSSFDPARMRPASLELGAAAYVEKGCPPEVLVGAIRGAAWCGPPRA